MDDIIEKFCQYVFVCCKISKIPPCKSVAVFHQNWTFPRSNKNQLYKTKAPYSVINPNQNPTYGNYTSTKRSAHRVVYY